MYSADNYARLGRGPRQSAEQIVPLLMELVRPTSVVDLGCGQGSWLAVFKDHGVQRITGVDGAWALPHLQVPAEYFVAGDLSRPINIPERYDLALCLEAAQYLPNTASEVLVTSLVQLAPVVLLSAGIPFQSGSIGTNARWPDYWKQLFEAKSYLLFDIVRPAVWENDRVVYYYAQNCLVFAHREYVESQSRWRDLQMGPRMPLRVVHPGHYLQKIEYLENPSLMATLGVRKVCKALLIAIKSASQSRLTKGGR